MKKPVVNVKCMNYHTSIFKIIAVLIAATCCIELNGTEIRIIKELKVPFIFNGRPSGQVTLAVGKTLKVTDNTDGKVIAAMDEKSGMTVDLSEYGEYYEPLPQIEKIDPVKTKQQSEDNTQSQHLNEPKKMDATPIIHEKIEVNFEGSTVAISNKKELFIFHEKKPLDEYVLRELLNQNDGLGIFISAIRQLGEKNNSSSIGQIQEKLEVAANQGIKLALYQYIAIGYSLEFNRNKTRQYLAELYNQNDIIAILIASAFDKTQNLKNYEKAAELGSEYALETLIRYYASAYRSTWNNKNEFSFKDNLGNYRTLKPVTAIKLFETAYRYEKINDLIGLQSKKTEGNIKIHRFRLYSGIGYYRESDDYINWKASLNDEQIKACVEEANLFIRKYKLNGYAEIPEVMNKYVESFKVAQ